MSKPGRYGEDEEEEMLSPDSARRIGSSSRGDSTGGQDGHPPSPSNDPRLQENTETQEQETQYRISPGSNAQNGSGNEMIAAGSSSGDAESEMEMPSTRMSSSENESNTGARKANEEEEKLAPAKANNDNLKDPPRLEYAHTIGPSDETIVDSALGVANADGEMGDLKERYRRQVASNGALEEMVSSKLAKHHNPSLRTTRDVAEVRQSVPGAVAVPGIAGSGGQEQEQDSIAESAPQTVMADAEVFSQPPLLTATLVSDTGTPEPVLYVHARRVPEYCVKVKQHKYKLLCLVLVLVGVGVALGILLPKDQPSTPPTIQTSPLEPTLEAVKRRGVLRCGVQSKLGFVEMDDQTGEMKGFEVDLCRAVAAAVLGETYRLETVAILSSERFTSVTNGTLDLVANSATHTMERDVFEANAKAGVSFSVPYLYDGLGFGGVPPFGSCANNENTLGNCAGLKVCVEAGTTHIDVLSEVLPSSSIVKKGSDKLVYKGLVDGECNAIAGEQFNIAEVTVRSEGYYGPYEVGGNLYSKEPLALVTRDGDPEWADFVDWVLQALFEAETRNITQESASNFDRTNVFGGEYENMFVNALAKVGNYGEMYDRYLGNIVPRQSVNMINMDRNASALLYAYPLGSASSGPGGPGPVQGGTLERIVQRGNLHCGIMSRAGFGEFNQTTNEWHGLDVDYCRALSASIFGGVFDSVEFVEVLDTDVGLTALADGDLDILAGGDVNLESDVMDPNSRRGFSFSQPYFYDTDGLNSLPADTLALVARQDDVQWADFVHWIVSATFYAEEENITRETSNKMPKVNLFGPKYERMFRDAILAVGNYGDMYSRNVETFIPRAGRNMLNVRPLGPQHYPFSGF